VELALALAKEKQVERASRGAKQGLSDRAKLKGLPPTKRKAYGYMWCNDKYVPDENYDNARLIWELALSGMKLKAICKRLFLQGIATANGKVFWQPSSVRAILTNPIYTGRVGALKYERVDPKKRRKDTFGKTSFRTKPIEEWHFLDGLVEKPVVSWDQFLAAQERLKLNQQYASRNAHHDFLLRGLVQCQECYARGENRHYYGLGRNKAYVCSAMWAQTFGRRCRSKAIPCQKIEDDVKAQIRSFLWNPDVWYKEASNRLGVDTIASIEQQIRDNERQCEKTITDERQAFRKLTPEAFSQEQALLKARRTWLDEEKKRLQITLSNLKRYDLKKEMIEHMSERLKASLDEATNEEWRFILEALGTKILAFGDGNWDIEINIPVTGTSETPNSIECKTPWCTFPC